jgi:fatty acid desaturase
MLNNQELRNLSQISAIRSTFQIFLDWGLLLIIYTLNIYYPHPFLILVSIPFIARQQMAFLVLLHDGAHGRLYKSHRVNDFMTQFFLGSPVFFSLRLYRRTHLKHHRIPLMPEDPDISLTGGYPINAKSFRRKLLRDLLGISYFKFMAHFMKYKKKQGKKSSETEVQGEKQTENFFLSSFFLTCTGLLINGSLFFMAYHQGHPLLYFVLWWVPIFTILQVYLRIRGITEHAGYKAGPDQLALSRTVVNPMETFFFSPNGVNYHIEHHAYPSVPFFNLPKVHRMLSERGSLPVKNVYQSYREVVRELVHTENEPT